METETVDSVPIPKEEENRQPESSFCYNDGNNDAGEFECNICFELAQDPIVTLCGHLFCWPCLYRWLHIHSRSQECPVCKALVKEEKLVPLYGRGRTPVDPRSKPVADFEIPSRPTGQRPRTAPYPEAYNVPNFASGFMGEFVPTANASFGNFPPSPSAGGFFPSFLNIHIHGFQNSGYTRHRFHGAAFHGGHLYEHHQASFRNHGSYHMKTFFLMAGALIILAMIMR